MQQRHILKRLQKAKLVLALPMLGFLWACEGHNPKENHQRSTFSPPLAFQQQIEHKRDGKIDLIQLIDPENRRLGLPSRHCSLLRLDEPRRGKRQTDYAATELACAREAFRTYYMSWNEYQAFLRNGDIASGELHYRNAVNSMALAMRRNEIQDRIMIRSDALCSDFQYRLGLQLSIQNDTTMQNWLQNNQARLVGGIGSLFLNSDTVWALSNAATITGMPGYLADRDQIEKTVMKLAVIGMNKKRDRIAGDINSRRFFIRHHTSSDVMQNMTNVYKQYHSRLQSLPQHKAIYESEAHSMHQHAQMPLGLISVGTYSLEQSLGDVIEYHNACSLGVGLDAAMADAVKTQ